MKSVSATAIVGGVCVIVVGICVWAAWAGARVNSTRSIPPGLYWTSSEQVKKGAYVLFCPPRRSVFDEARNRGYIGPGPCPGGYGYMMKKILATEHDVVSVTNEGVRINGTFLPHSMPRKTDGMGRPLPHYRIRNHVLDDTELMLMSDVSGKSFDGRYFGPVDRSQIRAVIRPVLTW